MFKLIMKIDDKITDKKNCNMILTEKQQKYQYYHNKKDEYECLTGKEILPFDQRQIIEQAYIFTKFTYPPLGKAFEKQIKAIEDQEKKQAEAIMNQNEMED